MNRPSCWGGSKETPSALARISWASAIDITIDNGIVNCSHVNIRLMESVKVARRSNAGNKGTRCKIFLKPKLYI